MDRRKRVISVLIILAVGLHALPVILRQGQNQTLWPFLGWAMYKDSRAPGPVQAEKRRIVAVTRGGATEEVNWALTGMPLPAIGRTFVAPLMRHDSAAARQLMDRLNAGRSDPVVELRLEIERYTIVDTGLAREQQPPLTYRLDSSDAR